MRAGRKAMWRFPAGSPRFFNGPYEGCTQDQPPNRHVPTTRWGMIYALKGWGGTAPTTLTRGAPLLELLAVANAMASSLRLGAGTVASPTRPTVLLQQPSRVRGSRASLARGSRATKIAV